MAPFRNLEDLTAATFIGGAVTGGTAGSVLFVDASGNLGQDNANLFWDDTNNRLGIGTATPTTALEVKGTGATNITVSSSGANTLDRGIRFTDQAGSDAAYIITVPGTVGTDTKMQFYVGGASAGDIHLRINDDGATIFGNDTGSAVATGGTSQVVTKHIDAAAEVLASWRLDEDTSSMVTIENATASNGLFQPLIKGVNGTTLTALFTVGQATTDTGSNPVMAWVARIGTGTAVATRPAYQWRNHTTEMMQLDALGRLRVNTAAAYSTSGLTSQGVLYYGSTGGILTLAAFSSSGNTQFNLNTAVGSGTNATRFSIGSTGRFNDSPAAITSGVATAWTWTTPADTGLTASTESNVWSTTSASRAWADGTVALQRDFAFLGNTWNKTTTSATFTIGATLFASTPIAGTGVTITNGYAAHFRANAITSAAETIALFDVSDATGYMVVENTTTTDAAALMGIRGVGQGTNAALTLIGQIATDTTTTQGALVLKGRTGAASTVDTRLPITFVNNTTIIGGFTGATDGGRLLIGGNNTVAYGAAGRLLELNKSATNSGAAFNTWSADASGGVLDFNKSRSATVGTHSIVSSGDDLGSLIFRGSDGTAFIPAASILSEVDGTPGTNDMPGRIVFSTTPDGAAAVVERMRIDSVGRVLIGSATSNGSPSSSTAFLQVQQAAITQETIAWFGVDDSSGSLVIMNGHSTATSFTGQVRGLGTTTATALALQGRGTTDTGANVITTFNSNIGGSTDVATRPAWNWVNNATTIMEISGTTAGSYLKTYYGRVKPVRSVSSTTITVAVTDHIVLSSTGGGAVAVSLPASPETGREYTIKDNVGDAGTNNITITPAAGNIDGAGTYVMNANNEAVTLVYNGTQWNVVSSHN